MNVYRLGKIGRNENTAWMQQREDSEKLGECLDDRATLFN
jgi:hypothetical protein